MAKYQRSEKFEELDSTNNWAGFGKEVFVELEAGKSEKAKFETKARANKMPGRQSVFSKFKSSKTGAEFVRKLKQK